MGVCIGECNPFTDEGCGENEQCAFGNVGFNGNRNEVPYGFCYENADPQGLATGQECESNEDACIAACEAGDMDCRAACEADGSPSSNCAPGHLCSALEEGGPNVCVKLCQDDDTSASCMDNTGCPASEFCNDSGQCQAAGSECPDGYRCAVGVFSNIDTVGICRR
jgi:hypothetical protein